MLKIAYNLLFHYDLFKPTAIVNNFRDLKQIIQKQKINYLVFDKDDTICPVYEFQIKNQDVKEVMDYVDSSHKFVVVVSNSVIVDQKNQPKQRRVDNGNGTKYFDILFTVYSKPFNGAQIQDHMKIQQKVEPSHHKFDKSRVAIIGDRLLTDIHLGNLMGWKSYLVKPLQQTTIQKHGIAVYIMRHFQNYLIKRSNFNVYKPQNKPQ